MRKILVAVLLLTGASLAIPQQTQRNASFDKLVVRNTLTVPSLGNAAVKAVTTSAYFYVDQNGNDSNDGLSIGTAFATPQKCNTSVLAQGGGTCDARTLYTYTSSTEIDVGDGVHAVTLLLPPRGAWTCTMTGGTAYCLKWFNGSSVIGTGSGEGQLFIIQAQTTANLDSVCGTDTTHSLGYVNVHGFACYALAGAVVSGAILNAQDIADESYIGNIEATTRSTTASRILWVHAACCSARVDQINAEGLWIANAVPCTFGNPGVDGMGYVDITDISCVHPGTGQHAAVLNQGANILANRIQNIYMETTLNDTTTSAFSVIGATGGTDFINGLSLGADTALSTRYTLDIISGAHVDVRDLTCGPISTNGINDHNAAPLGGTVTCVANTSIRNWGAIPFYLNGKVLPQTIGSGTVALGTALINTVTCAAAVNVSVTGAAATDRVFYSFNAAPTGAYLTGLFIQTPDVGTGSINFRVCNPTAGNLTPPAATLNWSVVR